MYGGIRDRIGAPAAVATPAASSSSVATAAPSMGGNGGARQPSSPYSATAPVASAGASTSRVLIALVILEAIALLALRGAFRNHHGG